MSPKILSMCHVIRPQVSDYLTSSGSAALGEAGVVVNYFVALANGNSYTWDSGSTGYTPEYFGGEESWTYQSNVASTPTNDVIASSISDSGVNLSLQDRATKRALIAGVLLGIAGGAIVGALQELTDRRHTRASGFHDRSGPNDSRGT